MTKKRYRSSPMGSDRTVSYKSTKELHARLQYFATNQGLSMSEVTRLALLEYINSHDKKGS